MLYKIKATRVTTVSPNGTVKTSVRKERNEVTVEQAGRDLVEKLVELNRLLDLSIRTLRWYDSKFAWYSYYADILDKVNTKENLNDLTITLALDNYPRPKFGDQPLTWSEWIDKFQTIKSELKNPDNQPSENKSHPAYKILNKTRRQVGTVARSMKRFVIVTKFAPERVDYLEELQDLIRVMSLTSYYSKYD